jgi:GT2 family glycosyltransferase
MIKKRIELEKLEIKKVFIVVAVYNRMKTTLSFVRQIMDQTYQNIELIIIDDCSTDGTAEKVRELCKDWGKQVVIRTDGNAWWGGCMHLGIDFILNKSGILDEDCVLLMNDDISFSCDLVANFIVATQQKPKSVLAAVPMHGTRIKSIGSNMVSWPFAISSSPYRGKEINATEIPDFIPIDFQYGHATLYPIGVVRKIGNIAYKQLPHYHGDGEYSYRAKKNGFSSYVVKSIRLNPDSNNTGLFNSPTNKHTIKEFIKSFIKFKSINNLKHRWEFAKLSTPRIWREMYFASEVAKSVGRSLLLILLSKKRSANTSKN